MTMLWKSKSTLYNKKVIGQQNTKNKASQPLIVKIKAPQEKKAVNTSLGKAMLIC
jgi:hypothetical protein